MITKTNNVTRQAPRTAIPERQIRRADNLFLINNEIKEISNKAVRAEFVAVPFLAVLSLVSGILHNSISQKQTTTNSAPTSNQNNSFLNNPFWIASTSNALLDLLSFLGELETRPICSIGNLIRMVVNGFMAFGNEQSKRAANIFYNFASTFIAIGWGINNQHDIETELYKHDNFFGKAKFQLNSFFTFWKELPKNLKEGNLWNNEHEHLSFKSRLPMFGYFSHALLALVSTGILLLSNLLPKEKVQHPLTNDDGTIRNSTESLGWKVGQASRFPLIASIFADAFSPTNLERYGPLGSLLKISYGISTIVNMLWMHNPDKAAQSDFAKNILSNTSSLWTRSVNNKINRFSSPY